MDVSGRSVGRFRAIRFLFRQHGFTEIGKGVPQRSVAGALIKAAGPQNARLVMKYKYASCPMERTADDPRAALYEERPYLTLNQWSVADVDGDPSQCGLAGSPTKVKNVVNIVFQAKESKTLSASDADVEGLVQELLNEKIIG